MGSQPSPLYQGEGPGVARNCGLCAGLALPRRDGVYYCTLCLEEGTAGENCDPERLALWYKEEGERSPPPSSFPAAASCAKRDRSHYCIVVRDGWYCCPECGPDAKVVIDYRQGDILCKWCGLVFMGHIIDETAEWNNYRRNEDGAGGDQSRVGDACNGGALTARIGRASNGPAGKSAAGHSNALARTLLHQQSRLQAHALSEVEREAAAMVGILNTVMSFPANMQDMARQMYVDFNAKVKRTKEPHKLAFQASCAYISSGANGNNSDRRDLEEVAIVFEVGVDEAKKCVTQLKDKLVANILDEVDRGDLLSAPPYLQTLQMHSAPAMGLPRVVRDLPAKVLDDQHVRPVINTAQWIDETIGPNVAGGAQPAKFRAAIITIAVCAVNPDVDEDALVKALKISVTTLGAHKAKIMNALGGSGGGGGLALKVEEFKRRQQRVAAINAVIMRRR